MTFGKIFILFITLCLISLNINSEERTLTYSFGSGDWYPIIYADEESEVGYRGLYKEVIDELFVNRLNCKIKYLVNPWKRAQQMVNNGEADFLITVATTERLKYSIKTDYPVFNLFMGLYTYKDHPRINEINKIKEITDIKDLNLRPVSNLGNGWHKQNIDIYGINTLYVKKDENIIKVLANKRADILVDTIIPMNHEIKKHGLSNKLILTDIKFGPIEFHILLSKKTISPAFEQEINKTLTKMVKEGYIEELAKKYSILE